MKRHAEQFAKRTASMESASFPFTGIWKNELKSTLELAVDQDGVVKGQFQSAVSDNGGPTDWFDVHGVASGDLIAFTVNWGCEITSWIGHGVHDEKAGPEILTLWQLVKNVPDIDDPETQWKTIMSGADNFFQADI